MKKAIYFFLGFFGVLVLLLIYRFVIDVPENYWKEKPSCTNELPFSTSAAFAEMAYQEAARNYLSAQLPKQFRYFFKTFLEEGEHTYMIVNFRNELHCFDVKMLVNKWDKLAGMKWANGKSYPKELHDLEWIVDSINGEEEVVYVDMHKIID